MLSILLAWNRVQKRHTFSWNPEGSIAVSLFRRHHISPHMRFKPAAPASILQTPREITAIRTVPAAAEHGSHNAFVHRLRVQPPGDGFAEVGCSCRCCKHPSMLLPGYLCLREGWLSCTCRRGGARHFAVHVSYVGSIGILRCDLSHSQLVLQGAFGKWSRHYHNPKYLSSGEPSPLLPKLPCGLSRSPSISHQPCCKCP